MKSSVEQLAEIGTRNLEMAVLHVLREAHEEDGEGWLGPAEVSKRAGLYRSNSGHRDCMALNILHKLLESGQVTYCEERPPRERWRIEGQSSKNE